MFNLKQKVLYGSQGVCEIQEITKKNFGGDERDYYVLVPVYRNFSTVYVPVDSPVICEKMRLIPDKDHMMELLKATDCDFDSWEENKYARHDKFIKILEKGTDSDIFALARMLHKKNEELMTVGKRLYINDEKVLLDAQRLIEEEFACVFDIPIESAREFINKNEYKVYKK
ncbi:MAG: hypothetical protein E7635_01990 [Ruminococcaceae bacterium]|nr:hypothetical protein [Oscillospiraceae bacterium]